MKTGHLDGQGLAELRNYNAQNLSSAPTTNLYAGRFYFSTTDNTLYVYDGTTWLDALKQGIIYTEGTGIDISDTTISVDFTDVATASQGALADTALQPNDNISELTNNVGYITSSALSGYVPTSRTINGKALTSNISLDYSDVSALADTTTINDLTTSAQQNALNSGATTTNIGQIATNTTAISTINGKIPSQASTTNQLADKAFVNSSVQTATANFRGNWETWASVPTDANSYPADYTGSKTPTVNDYLVVQDASGYTEDTLEGTWRFKYSGEWSTDGKNGWLPEYQVNETPMTASQLEALNSGITSTLVGQITTNANNISNIQSTMITASSTNTLTNKTIDADDNTISDLTTSNFKSSAISTLIPTTGTVNTKFTTEKSVRDAINTSIGALRQDESSPELTPSGGVCTWTISTDIDIPIVEVFDGNGEKILCDYSYTSGTVTIKILSTSTIPADSYYAVLKG